MPIPTPSLNADDTAPAYDAVAVTLNADVKATRALYLGATGDVTVVMSSGSTATFKAVPAGSILPICVTRVTAAPADTLLLY